uniref:Uncharacterized protein n=1 Tax=Anguilla anguilla TaxID=7936 RepID=A0A0E9VDK9_ANGAN
MAAGCSHSRKNECFSVLCLIREAAEIRLDYE